MTFPYITDPLLRQAMDLPPDDAVEQSVLSSINLLQTRLGDPHGITLSVPKIEYDLKGTTAGRAYFNHKTGEARIRINNALLYSSHKEDMIRSTVPHEVAHCVARQVYGRGIKPHGYEWASIMHLLGLPATRCHNYEVKKARNRQKMDRPFVYECACNRQHKMTKITHRRAQNGETYICQDCHRSLRYVGKVQVAQVSEDDLVEQARKAFEQQQRG